MPTARSAPGKSFPGTRPKATTFSLANGYIESRRMDAGNHAGLSVVLSNNWIHGNQQEPPLYKEQQLGFFSTLRQNMAGNFGRQMSRTPFSMPNTGASQFICNSPLVTANQAMSVSSFSPYMDSKQLPSYGTSNSVKLFRSFNSKSPNMMNACSSEIKHMSLSMSTTWESSMTKMMRSFSNSANFSASTQPTRTTTWAWKSTVATTIRSQFLNIHIASQFSMNLTISFGNQTPQFQSGQHQTPLQPLLQKSRNISALWENSCSLCATRGQTSPTLSSTPPASPETRPHQPGRL